MAFERSSHSVWVFIASGSSSLTWLKIMFICVMMIIIKDFIYSFMRDTERGRDIEGEAGSLQGARWELDPRTSGSWPESRRSTAEPPRCPCFLAISVSFLEKYPIFCLFLIELFLFMLLSQKTYLCILHAGPLSDVLFGNILSYSVVQKKFF